MLQERMQFHHARLAEHITAYNGYGWQTPLAPVDTLVQAAGQHDELSRHLLADGHAGPDHLAARTVPASDAERSGASALRRDAHGTEGSDSVRHVAAAPFARCDRLAGGRRAANGWRNAAEAPRALGFSDLWVTENTLGHVTCLDPVVALTYAAAVTSRIRLGASVVVLANPQPAAGAHQWATLDHLSDGRAILGVGWAASTTTASSKCPRRAVRRFPRGGRIIRALWTQRR